jgi:hypothetical protein
LKWSTACSTFSRSGWSIVRSASLAKGGTSKRDRHRTSIKFRLGVIMFIRIINLCVVGRWTTWKSACMNAINGLPESETFKYFHLYQLRFTSFWQYLYSCVYEKVWNVSNKSKFTECNAKSSPPKLYIHIYFVKKVCCLATVSMFALTLTRCPFDRVLWHLLYFTFAVIQSGMRYFCNHGNPKWRTSIMQRIKVTIFKRFRCEIYCTVL